MLIPFQDLLKKHNIQPTGVIHIGANTGQEAAAYYAANIHRSIWIEPIQKVFEELQKNIGNYKDAVAFNECVSSLDGMSVDFNITDNNGESSSFLKMGTHATVHPSVKVVNVIPMITKRVDTLFAENKIDISGYDFLNIDIQGAELFALKGMGQLLSQIKYAYLEVNKEELYKDCALIGDIDAYMDRFSFKRVETQWAGDTGWGDAFYIKSTVANNAELLASAAPFVPVPGVTLLQPEMQPVNTAPFAFSKLVKKFKLNIRGIINAGASEGDDMAEYQHLGIDKVVLIEPNYAAFDKLKRNYQLKAHCINAALAEYEGSMTMNLSTGDNGRSDSFLTPIIQTTQYPHIKYQGRNTVTGSRLDRLGINVGVYNTLHLDTNGYELSALKGAMEFLPHIDYVYSKVYFAELFQHCPKVEDVDAYLSRYKFERVETSKEGITWGHALYMKTTNPLFPKEKHITEFINDVPAAELSNAYLETGIENEFVQNVPSVFRPHIKIPSPADNKIPYEEWFYKHFSFADHIEGMVYLPIFWNSYYVNNDIENNPEALQPLQEFIDSLDPAKKYYTICMYHKGVLNQFTGLEVTVIGTNYHASDVYVPTVCQPHAAIEGANLYKKDLHLSYIAGADAEIHPVRREIFEVLEPAKNSWWLYLGKESLSLEDYCKILARSKYVICPDGFKDTNFRIAEALQFGAVPVVFTNKLSMADQSMDMSKKIIIANKSNLFENINKFEQDFAFSDIDETQNFELIPYTVQHSLELYGRYYTFEGCKKTMLETLRK